MKPCTITPSSFSTSGSAGADESSLTSSARHSARCPMCQNLWYGRQSSRRLGLCTAMPLISVRSRHSISSCAVAGEVGTRPPPPGEEDVYGGRGRCGN